MMANNGNNSHSFRASIDNRKHINAKGILQTGLLEKEILNSFCVRTLFQLNHNPDAFFGRLIGDISNIIGGMIFNKSIGIEQEFTYILSNHRIRNLGNNKLFLSALNLLYLHLTADLNLTFTCGIDLQKFVLIRNYTARWEIRAGNIFHHLGRIDIRILHISNDTVDYFGQIMRRNGGNHTNRNTICSIHEKVRNLNRKHFRFLLCLIEVGNEVNHVLIEITKESLLGNLLKSGLGITHCSGAITFDGTEVTMTINKRQFLLEILRHNNQGVIDRGIAMRMIFTHGITYNTR